MTQFADFAALCRQLETSRGRLEKRRLVAEFLRNTADDEVSIAVAFLTGRPFPAGDPRVLSVRGLPVVDGTGVGAPLTLGDVETAFAAVAESTGSGSRRAREE